MKKWKSKKQTPHGVWVTEINLVKADATRIGKVKKLLKLLKEDFNEDLS